MRKRLIFLLGVFFFSFSQVILGNWVAQERLSFDLWTSMTTSSNPCAIAADASGNRHVVWRDDRNRRGTSYEIYYKKYSPTSGWGLETRLTFEVLTGIDGQGNPILQAHNKNNPGIVADAEGNLFVSYENVTASSPCVLRWDAATRLWGAETVLGSGGLADINPVLAVDSDNNVHAVWRALVDGHPQVFYGRYTGAAGWGTPEQLTTEASQKKTPLIAVDAADNLQVVFTDSRDSGVGIHDEIYYKKKPAGGRWSGDTRLSVAVDSDSQAPHLACAPDGNLHLAWEDDRDGNFEIYYRCFAAATGAWGPEERLTTEGSPSLDPHLAVDSSNQVHLVWHDGRYLGGGSLSRLSLFYKKKTAAWGDDLRLARQGVQGSLVADAATNLHLVYTAPLETVGNPDIYYLKFDPFITDSPPPNEVVLVLDTSGSMAWDDEGAVPARPEDSRLFRAGQALSSFLDRYNLRNESKAYFGLVTFPHASHACPSAQDVIPGTGPLPQLNDVTRLDAINHVIPGLTARGRTPMVEGLTLASSLLTPDRAPQMMLLVSDGFHNCPSRDFPADFLAGLTVPIYTVGIGRAVEVDLPKLDEIAAATGGEFRDATAASSLDLVSWMKTIIQSVLGLEAECDPAGVISSGQKITHPVWITDRDSDISFDISWHLANPDSIEFVLRTPAGRFIRAKDSGRVPGITHISRPTYQVFYLEEKFLKTMRRAGKWTIELLGRNTGQNLPETYQYGVTMRSPLKLLVEFNRRQYRVGQPVVIQASVCDGKRRLPADLRLSIRSSAQGPTMPSQEPIRLGDSGRQGDLKAGDGIYTFVFTGTATDGTYTFDLTAKGKTSSGQVFRRERILQRYVLSNIKKKEPVYLNLKELPK